MLVECAPPTEIILPVVPEAQEVESGPWSNFYSTLLQDIIQHGTKKKRAVCFETRSTHWTFDSTPPRYEELDQGWLHPLNFWLCSKRGVSTSFPTVSLSLHNYGFLLFTLTKTWHLSNSLICVNVEWNLHLTPWSVYVWVLIWKYGCSA